MLPKTNYLSIYILFLISGEVNFSESIKESQNISTFRMVSTMDGGETRIFENDIDRVIEKARTFTNDVRNVSVPYEVYLQDYKVLDLPPEPTFIEIQNQDFVLKELLEYRDKCQQLLNDILYIKLYPEQFNSPQNFNISEIEAKLKQQLTPITQRAQQCVVNLGMCNLDDS